MANEAGRPCGMPVHATAVAIDGGGLLIFGASGSGKSRLACALIAASTVAHQIRLVGDDRLLLHDDGENGWWARPHPRIAGFIERRGLGIVAMPHVARIRARGVVTLTDGRSAPPPVLAALPCWRPPAAPDDAGGAHAVAILDWWRDVTTTPGSKPPSVLRSGAKD